MKKDKCFEKVAKIRKEIELVLPADFDKKVVEPSIVEDLYFKMAEKRLMLDRTVTKFVSELVIVPFEKDPAVGIPRQRITKTVAYTVVDVDDNDTFGPFHITTTTDDSLENNDNSQEENEWAALVAIFHLDWHKED